MGPSNLMKFPVTEKRPGRVSCQEVIQHEKDWTSPTLFEDGGRDQEPRMAGSLQKLEGQEKVSPQNLQKNSLTKHSSFSH